MINKRHVRKRNVRIFPIRLVSSWYACVTVITLATLKSLFAKFFVLFHITMAYYFGNKIGNNNFSITVNKKRVKKL